MSEINKPKQVLDIRGDKGVPGGMSDEIQRRWGEKAWAKAAHNGNYDRSRAHLNFRLIVKW